MKQALQHWWQQRDAREQRLLALAAVCVAAALLWLLAIAPALRTIRSANEQQARLQLQLQDMARLQAEARTLQAQAPVSAGEAASALTSSVQQAFGNAASISLRSSDAQVTLNNVSPDALAQWLATVRANAHASVLNARLSRSGTGWSGTLQLGLPAQ